MDLAILAVIAAVVLLLLAGAFFIVDQQTIGIVERLGRFKRTANAGINVKIPVIDRVRGRLSLRVQQLDVSVETKTSDNVFVNVVVSVQFLVLKEKIFEAFYRLTSPTTQIQSFVFDVVRAKVPTMTLDAVFDNKDQIANAVKEELTETMTSFGYGIVKALVTDIDPDKRVKAAMNEINEQQRLRVAANAKGEAEKILIVKQAEAQADSMRLNGQGIADQRKAIIHGLKQSVDEFTSSIPDAAAADVINLVLMVQYYDTLKEIGASDRSSTILVPHSPSVVPDLSAQLRESIITGNLATQANKAEK